MKKIYIIEVKISIDKLQRLRQILNTQEQGFTAAESCTRADYIVTELKSPSRIVKNSKMSTCPVVHIGWLLESIRQGKILDPRNFMIDVSESRQQEAAELAYRVTEPTLPNQLTWDQVVARRRIKRNDSMFAGVQERRRFQFTHGSRSKSYQPKVCIDSATVSVGCTVKREVSSSELGTLKREINCFATTVSHTPGKRTCTTTPPLSRASSSFTASTSKEAQKAASPTIKTEKESRPSLMEDMLLVASSAQENLRNGLESSGMIEPVALETIEALSTQPQLDKGTTMLNFQAQDDSPSAPALDRLRQILFATPLTSSRSSTKRDASTIKHKRDSPKRTYADVIKSESCANLSKAAEEQNQPTTNSSSLKRCRNIDYRPIMDEESNIKGSRLEDSDFSVISYHPQPNNDVGAPTSTSVSTHEKGNSQCQCSVEQITHSLSLSSVDDSATTAEVPHTCGSVSSSDFDPNQYSLSAILSL